MFNRKIKTDGFLSAQLKSTRSLFQGWWVGIDIKIRQPLTFAVGPGPETAGIFDWRDKRLGKLAWFLA
ncbi:hypothetical protein D1BOALGB6SA_8230 [Olavius sp. associated proteobacterium Delta 1]|nr:hypothetical protein D1BOALGB6SA_8230 [Olavius sp. associated proteobacterium Delta 1]